MGARLSRQELGRLKDAAQRAAESGMLNLSWLRGEDKIPFNDIRRAAAHFDYQTRVLDSYGIPQPCLIAGPWTHEDEFSDDAAIIPVNMIDELGEPRANYGEGHADYVKSVVSQHVDSLYRAEMPVAYWPSPLMRSSFAEGMFKFLRARIEAFRRRFFPFAPLRPTPPGLAVTVKCQNHGLKILCSPAFFLTETAFGSGLSTPVTGHLQPGIYIFGSQSRDSDVVWETALEPIPPNTTVHMVRA